MKAPPAIPIPVNADPQTQLAFKQLSAAIKVLHANQTGAVSTNTAVTSTAASAGSTSGGAAESSRRWLFGVGT